MGWLILALMGAVTFLYGLSVHAALLCLLVKPLPVLALLGWLHDAPPSEYRRWISLGLIFSLLGDVLLAWPGDLFVFGLGAFLVAQSERGICAILLGNEAKTLIAELETLFPHSALMAGDELFAQNVAQVVSLLERPGQQFDLPLDIQGTAFQQQVWQALREIPSGQTASYRDIAERIGKPQAVRAVAGACAANKLAVIIPCHRVVRNDGAISGYRWGVERKRQLLKIEAEQQGE